MRVVQALTFPSGVVQAGFTIAWCASSMQASTLDLSWWRLPAALAASAVLASALASIGASLWLGVCVGALAGIRVAEPLLRHADSR